MILVETDSKRPNNSRDGAPVVRTQSAARTTVFRARVVPVKGLLARIAVQLNPYDVRDLRLSLDEQTLRIVVGGTGFDASRVAARLEKVIGVLEVEITT